MASALLAGGGSDEAPGAGGSSAPTPKSQVPEGAVTTTIPPRSEVIDVAPQPQELGAATTSSQSVGGRAVPCEVPEDIPRDGGAARSILALPPPPSRPQPGQQALQHHTTPLPLRRSDREFVPGLMVALASIGFVGPIIRLPSATVKGTSTVTPAALVTPSSSPLVMVAYPPSPLVITLPFTTPLEEVDESSTATEGRVVRAVSSEVVVLTDSMSSEVAAGHSGAEVASKQSMMLDQAVLNHTI
ncbi:probable endo-1,3(4)-beta-glucanase AFLA_105200 [Setaria italica]|uniref:probable endo-1,3(4)-beta-glucanase AFLA_105200 n=1 Tax=Setaria italica TaxID=4555 RepID=UPI000350BFA8|nr:probable endo-1,3(4)-beta-glucanase AFLA_105200 [Setaria italica]